VDYNVKFVLFTWASGFDSVNSFMTCVATLSGVVALFGEEVICKQILVIYSACISFTTEFIS